MWSDDKLGIGWGRFTPMSPENYGKFDGSKFTLDETGLDKEFHGIANAGANFVGAEGIEKIGLTGQSAV